MITTRLKNIYTCFPGGKHKVLTMSYDDGRTWDRKLVELFNSYKIKGTFHLNSGLTDGERVPQSEWADLYQGHEISCHTVLHPTIERCPVEQVALQVLEDRRNLERSAGYPVRGLSYPPMDLTARKYFLCCRGLGLNTAGWLGIPISSPCRKTS